MSKESELLEATADTLTELVNDYREDCPDWAENTRDMLIGVVQDIDGLTGRGGE